jgi:ElaB/YqjD/DUF883 family membrane-anchored ribosome-binding protein
MWRKKSARSGRQQWTKSGAAFALGAVLAAVAAYGFSRLNRQLQDGGGEQLRQQAGQKLSQTRSAVEHTAHVAGERLEQTREVVGQKAQNLGARVSETAPEIVSRVGQTAQNLGARVSETAPEIVNRVSQTVGQTAQAVGERVEQVRERLSTKADEAAAAKSEIDAQVSDLAQQASSVAAEAGSQAREQVDRIVEQIESGAGDQVEQAQNAGEKAREQVDRIVSKLDTGVGDAVEKVEEVSEEASVRLGASESLGHEARRPEPGAEQAVDVADMIAAIVPGVESDGDQGLVSVDAPVTEVPAVSIGMKVVAFDGTDIGRIKDVREDGFVLSRPRGGDLLAPLDSVYKVEDTLVYLRIKANQVARQGWETVSGTVSGEEADA